MSKRTEPSEEAQLAARICRAYRDFTPYTCASLAKRLERLARRQQLHDERDCSEEWYSRPDHRGTTPSERAERAIDKATKALEAELPGSSIERNGDPRGGYFVVTLKGEEMRR
jgi:hypothetical protein